MVALEVKQYNLDVSHENTTACRWLDHEDVNSDAGCEQLIGAMVSMKIIKKSSPNAV